MFASNDDDDLFIPTASSNLASLFHSSNEIVSEKNQSLSYSAPRQPKLPSQKSDNTSVAVLCAKVVQVYKLVNNQYALQGRFGLAITGNSALKLYEIIIYKDKQNVLQKTRINPEFRLILQPNNFASFFDESKQNWSIYFDNIKDLNDVTHQLEIIGVKVIPIVENDVPDIKTIIESKPEPLTPKPKLTMPENAKETFTDNEIDASSNSNIQSTRDSILTRMAKMGQPTLMPKQEFKPKLPKNDISDSETDSSDVRIRKAKKSLVKPTADKDVTNTTNAQSHNYVIINGQCVPVLTDLSEMPKTSLINYEPSQRHFLNDPMQILLSENRTHNSEVRMHLFRLTTKLEDLQNLKYPHNEQTTDSQFGSSIETKLNTVIKLLENQSVKSHSNELHDHEINLYKRRIKELEDLVEYQTKKLDSFESKESAVLKDIIEQISKQTDEIKEFKTLSNNNATSLNSNVTKYKDNVKKTMNVLYKDINDKFDNNQTYESEIKSVLANKIVDTTYKIIQSFSTNFENNTVLTNVCSEETESNSIEVNV